MRCIIVRDKEVPAAEAAGRIMFLDGKYFPGEREQEEIE